MCSICIQWIQSHAHVFGNGVADLLALPNSNSIKLFSFQMYFYIELKQILLEEFLRDIPGIPHAILVYPWSPMAQDFYWLLWPDCIVASLKVKDFMAMKRVILIDIPIRQPWNEQEALTSSVLTYFLEAEKGAQMCTAALKKLIERLECCGLLRACSRDLDQGASK